MSNCEICINYKQKDKWICKEVPDYECDLAENELNLHNYYFYNREEICKDFKVKV
jgi:hypothetical protein